ncbi:MAG: DNA replication/repair protein RecF, partial [Pseudomonadota bacterium]
MTHSALTRLALQNFRNHAQTVLTLDGRHVCLYGANGAGKTNLLEAVSMLGPGKGLRSAALPSLVRQSDDLSGWALSATFSDNGLDRRIGVSLEVSPDGRSKRIAKLDGAPSTQNDLADLLRIVWLTPAMDRVFAGPAGDRRKFYDRQVLAHAPAHGRAASAYEKAMRDRNALLEQPSPDLSWLDALEARMGDAGAAMATYRAQTLKRLQAVIDARPEGAFPKADLALEGVFEQSASNGAGLEELAQSIADGLRSGRSRDAAVGRALTGVHRSDLAVIHRPKSTPAAQCSTGEQKALLIGLILANAQALFEGDLTPNPLLLLDEAAAH